MTDSTQNGEKRARVREVRRQARQAMASLLWVNVDAGEGDLFVGVEGEYDDEQMRWFTDEIRRWIVRILPTDGPS